jgi:type II secretory pathway pseudopilin PulG
MPTNAGYSFIELMFAAGLMATVAGLAAPPLLATADDLKTVAAVRYVSGLLQQIRADAVLRHADTAMRFTSTGSSYVYGEYVDGNLNGVKSTEITSGVDREVRRPERLSDQFPGVDFGTLPGLPPIDSSSSAPGADPIKLGASTLATFTSVGTSTSGSLYILGRRNTQYVIRIYGETGKTRILRFDTASRVWKPL